MSKVITQDNEQVIQIYNRLKDTLTRLEDILKNNNPTLNGHRYMNDAELANYLKVSRRTLQEYRNNGILSYYQIGGKILYRESDIEELLEKNRQEAFRLTFFGIFVDFQSKNPYLCSTDKELYISAEQRSSIEVK